MEEILRGGFETLGVKVPADAPEKLRAYAALLKEKNAVMNLTAIREDEDVARLHFLDCAALLRFLDLRGKRLLDVGSGAGFPGLVLKILCPEMELTMLDSQQKRVAFQRETAAALGLEGVTALAGRAEEMGELRESFDVVTSRAVAGLGVLCELCLPLVRVGGVFAAMKGPDPAEELSQAREAVRLLGGGNVRTELYAIPGVEAGRSLILAEKLTPTPAKYPRRYAAIKKQPLGKG